MRDIMAVIMGMTIPMMRLRNFINGPMELNAWMVGIESYLNGIDLEISWLPSRKRSHIPLPVGTFEDEFPFPLVGYVIFLEGKQPSWASSFFTPLKILRYLRPRTTGSSLPWQGICCGNSKVGVKLVSWTWKSVFDSCIGTAWKNLGVIFLCFSLVS